MQSSRLSSDPTGQKRTLTREREWNVMLNVVDRISARYMNYNLIAVVYFTSKIFFFEFEKSSEKDN